MQKMKIMKRYIYMIIMVCMAVLSCQKLDYPEADSSNTISSLKCFVYYDSENLRSYQELDVLNGGTFNQQMGAVTYTFNHEKCTSETLKNCRLEATIPSTAKLVETDAAGNETGSGIGGMRDLSASKTTVYFKVVAPDGSEKKYQVQFQFNK